RADLPSRRGRAHQQPERDPDREREQSLCAQEVQRIGVSLDRHRCAITLERKQRVMQPLTWEPELARACAWIDDRIAAFHVDGAANQLLPSLKAIAELAHAGELLMRTSEPRGRRWLEHAWTMTERGELLCKLIHANPRLVIAATTLVPFHLAG